MQHQLVLCRESRLRRALRRCFLVSLILDNALMICLDAAVLRFDAGLRDWYDYDSVTDRLRIRCRLKVKTHVSFAARLCPYPAGI